jgi:hypothetical protein
MRGTAYGRPYGPPPEKAPRAEDEDLRGGKEGVLVLPEVREQWT